jgi:hypothetical protein
LLGDARGLRLALGEQVPEPIRLFVHRLFVHLDDSGPYCPIVLTTPGLRALIAAGLKISSRASVAAARALVSMLGS